MNWQKSQEWNDCWRVLSACALACLELVEHRFRRHNSRHLPALCFTLWNINRFTEFTELRNQEGAGRFSFRLLLIWMRFLHELWRQKEHCGNGFWVINQQFSNWETKSDLKYCPVRFTAAHQFSFRINVESCVALPRQTLASWKNMDRMNCSSLARFQSINWCWKRSRSQPLADACANGRQVTRPDSWGFTGYKIMAKVRMPAIEKKRIDAKKSNRAFIVFNFIFWIAEANCYKFCKASAPIAVDLLLNSSVTCALHCEWPITYH